MNYTAIIPARSGSKGVKNKNIKTLGEMPLMAYSIIAASFVKKINRIIVSTDCQEYAKIAQDYGAEVPFIRPKGISQDQSTDYEFFIHLLDWLKKKEKTIPKYLIHLRPTTPLREPEFINRGIELFEKNIKKATSLRSGHVSSESPFKWFLKDSKSFFKGLRNDLTPENVNQPRQMFPNVYIPNGYVDILKSSNILKQGNLHGDKMLVFETPFCTEVDSLDDFKYLEYQIEKFGSSLTNKIN